MKIVAFIVFLLILAVAVAPQIYKHLYKIGSEDQQYCEFLGGTWLTEDRTRIEQGKKYVDSPGCNDRVNYLEEILGK